MSAIAHMIEVAQSEGRYFARKCGDEKLVVLDGLTENPQSGVRVTVWYDGRGFVSECYDGSGRAVIASGTQRIDAVQRSLDGYLDIVNNGI